MNAAIFDVEGIVFYCVGENDKIDDLKYHTELQSNCDGQILEILVDRIIGSGVYAHIKCKKFRDVFSKLKLKQKLSRSHLYIDGDLFDGAAFLLNPAKTAEILGISGEKVEKLKAHYTKALSKIGIEI
ncbi:hypothetical protein [Enterocloster lavalensis]|uniref:hypothetical protein n=1 Tax=Enterocloster lavalensis TaxID=460384 RepID=UPI0034A2218F